MNNSLLKKESHENLLSRYMKVIFIYIKILKEWTFSLITHSSFKKHSHFNKIKQNTSKMSAVNVLTELDATCWLFHKQIKTAFACLSVMKNTLNIKYCYEMISEDCACMICECYSLFHKKKNLLCHLWDINNSEHLTVHIILQATTCFQCSRIFLKSYKLVEHKRTFYKAQYISWMNSFKNLFNNTM